MPSQKIFHELCVKITLLRSSSKKILTVCNAVYFRLCIDLMHITPPVTAEGIDGSHHPRYAECLRSSSLNHFVNEIVSPLPGSSGLVRHVLLFFFFKQLISFVGFLDKCHISVFNALIYFFIHGTSPSFLESTSFPLS